MEAKRIKKKWKKCMHWEINKIGHQKFWFRISDLGIGLSSVDKCFSYVH